MITKAAIEKFYLAIRERLSFDDPALNKDCAEFEVNNRTISRFIMHKLVPIVGMRPFPLNEQILMVLALCRLQPTHIFEWGTNIGKSARIYSETSRAFGIPAEIHSVDLPDDAKHGEHPGGRRGRLVKGKRGVTLYIGDGIDTSWNILGTINNTSIRPLFFVDGDHSYISVKRELECTAANVPSADILLHDTFYQSSGSGYNIGPPRAIEDVISRWPDRSNRISQNIGLPGMTLLWRRGHTGSL